MIVHVLKLSSEARTHLLGALVVIGLGGLTWAAVMSNGLHAPGTRAVVLFGGVAVTLALLARDLHNRLLAVYGGAFLLSFLLFTLAAALTS